MSVTQTDHRRDLGAVAMLRMMAPEEGFCGGTLFRSKNRWRSKKGLRCNKMSGFSVQKYVKNKQKKFSPKNQWIFGPDEDGGQTKWKK